MAGERFIPAGAGNTLTLLSTADTPAVYPRWRGEHFIYLAVRSRANGLSPLARGTQAGKLVIIGDDRFIPAGAGNTGWEISHNR